MANAIVFLYVLVAAAQSTITTALFTVTTQEEYEENFDAKILFLKDPVGAEFSCEHLPPRSIPANTVHELRPDDIKVVAAMGDSITAGFYARSTYFWQIIEYTGVSWSIGGYLKNATMSATIPNFLEFYNADVKGASMSFRPPLPCISIESQNNLNVAMSGSTSGLLMKQAMNMKKIMERRSDINIDEDWKLITLWIGGNDLCFSCVEGITTPFCDFDNITVENFLKDVEEALVYLKDNVPKAFVNLVNVVDVTLLREIQGHEGCPKESPCYCLNEGTLHEMAIEMQNGMSELAAKGSLTTDTFTVVLQPFFEEMALPPDPVSYFAPDCFHFSTKGHATAAVSLWNNMLEPVGHKSTGFQSLEAKCPSKENNYYFYTSRNSAAVPNDQKKNEL
ncbi:phospholipase B1, membrane-associated-like isoform X2 [Oscarella lobularis]|uniref:phospholipase B1, membrane-associated-like isoform X2 n=1 Tax=Oscarella lobularis TaxID=121494 RepID=UPI0033131456